MAQTLAPSLRYNGDRPQFDLISDALTEGVPEYADTRIRCTFGNDGDGSRKRELRTDIRARPGVREAPVLHHPDRLGIVRHRGPQIKPAHREGAAAGLASAGRR